MEKQSMLVVRTPDGRTHGQHLTDDEATELVRRLLELRDRREPAALTRLTVRPFMLGTDKDAALKPLEEAAEVYGAWQIQGQYPSDGLPKVWLACEIADCVTACANLAARYGIDLQAALDRVEDHNRERGRYKAKAGGDAPRQAARAEIVCDGSTDGATGYCRCGACHKTIDPWDSYCRHCGTEVKR